MPAGQQPAFDDVSFVYDGGAEPLFERLSLRFSPTWYGIIGANGSGKTTFLRLACGELAPTAGSVTVPARVVYCPQRTDDPPPRFDRMIESSDADACALLGRLEIGVDWLARWPTLSHGERKRAQIATALWLDPAMLAIDEPTNHIDADARELLARALRAFRGIGLLVSHDRALLDELCEQTLFLDPPTATLRPGGYSKAIQLAEAEQDRARAKREQAKRQLARLEREASARRREAGAADRKRSKRHLAKGDSDGRARIDLARVSGKDGQAGRLLRQLEGRLRQMQERADSAHVKKEFRLGVELLGEPSRRNTLLQLGPGQVPLGGSRVLRFNELVIQPTDRIAITGPNGAGKSTLVRHVLDRLDLPPDRIVYLPQEIDAGTGARVLAAVRRMPHEQLGGVMSAISCLGSRPQRLLTSDDPSPGELRKILLALGLTRVPHLIVMDEPTNHLDLPSIRCLEEALADVRCAMLLVTHDAPFLQRLATSTWQITRDGDSRDSSVRVLALSPAGSGME